jgi:hypothetical protein
MIDTLRPEDRFTVIAFDDVVETPPGFGGTLPVPATERFRVRAVEFLAELQARRLCTGRWPSRPPDLLRLGRSSPGAPTRCRDHLGWGLPSRSGRECGGLGDESLSGLPLTGPLPQRYVSCAASARVIPSKTYTFRV